MDQHHKSKRAGYDLVLVPRDDASIARSVRFAPWQVYLLVAGSVVLVAAVVLAALLFTPLGALVPIENAELVNRYSKELVSLNQRMMSLMEQLVELREYNVKLRKALGEQVVATDTGVVVVGGRRSGQTETRRSSVQAQSAAELLSPQTTRLVPSSASLQSVAEERHFVVFPVVLPAEGYITRSFDPERRHFGLDVAGKIGSLVNAAADGYVVFAGWTIDDGYKIILSHAGGFLTIYKHNQSLLKSALAFARRGEPIALLGNSGQTSMGPHVHFEIWKDGVPVNPANYILNLNF